MRNLTDIATNEEIKIAKSNYSKKALPIQNSFDFLPLDVQLELIILAYREKINIDSSKK